MPLIMLHICMCEYCIHVQQPKPAVLAGVKANRIPLTHVLLSWCSLVSSFD
jgi:hypothetical protein